MKKIKFIRIILNLFDGDAAGTAASAEASEGDGGSASTGNREAKARARELGLSDDLVDDFEKAFYRKSEPEKDDNNENNEEAGENLDDEFDKLIQGKFKAQYKSRMENQIKDRVQRANRERKALEENAAKSEKILSLLNQKYGGDSGDIDGLYDKLRGDEDFWRQKALDSGRTVDEVMTEFDEAQTRAAQQQELESLRQFKAASELDARLQAQAAELVKDYPDFDLKIEMENPDFQNALDIIAERNAARNKSSGRNDEIFNVKKAYEMAHFDELSANTIKRASKATASAVAQTIQANRNRPQENVTKHTTQSKAKDYGSMSDEEFSAYLEKVKRGEAKI